MPHVFRRSSKEKKIAGICGGLAELFQFDVALIRLFLSIAAIAFMPLFLVYIATWMIIPVATEPTFLQD